MTDQRNAAISFRFVFVFLILLTVSCQSSSYRPAYTEDTALWKKLNAHRPDYPDFVMGHISDPHVFDPQLGVKGAAFQSYLIQDRKMIRESVALAKKAMENLAHEKPDFIFVTGDLTKDGERKSHTLFTGMIQKIQQSGTRVIVIPGNHDINNPQSYGYKEDKSVPVNNVSPQEFRTLYGDFGYNDALMEDENSLSYVAEPVPGLWVLALDSNRYANNIELGHSVTDGRFSPETIAWIESALQKAMQKNKAVIVGMHHGILEHYRANSYEFTQYVVDEGDSLARMLSTYGVKVVFTGHFHAQDITVRKWKQHGQTTVLYDIETGSPITFPSPYRIIRVRDNIMHIKSKRVRSIPGMADVQGHGRQFIHSSTVAMARSALDSYLVSEEDAGVLAPWIADSYLEHLQGDESGQVRDPFVDKDGPGLMGSIALAYRRGLIESWVQDLAPADNELRIDLQSGHTAKPDQ